MFCFLFVSWPGMWASSSSLGSVSWWCGVPCNASQHSHPTFSVIYYIVRYFDIPYLPCEKKGRRPTYLIQVQFSFSAFCFSKYGENLKEAIAFLKVFQLWEVSVFQWVLHQNQHFFCKCCTILLQFLFLLRGISKIAAFLFLWFSYAKHYISWCTAVLKALKCWPAFLMSDDYFLHTWNCERRG